MHDPTGIPDSLRQWFLAHAVAAFALALPLLAAPEAFLARLGWQSVDPVASRLLGAALLAIGGQSLRGRRGDARTMRILLDFNVTFSAAAAFGLFVSIVNGAPSAAFAFLSAFIALAGVWFHHRVRLRQWEHRAHRLDETQPEDEPGTSEPDEA